MQKLSRLKVNYEKAVCKVSAIYMLLFFNMHPCFLITEVFFFSRVTAILLLFSEIVVCMVYLFCIDNH